MSATTEDGDMPRRTLLARDVFPAWLSAGPWPYEVGLTFLMIWFADCLRVAEELLPRYGDSPFFGWVLTSGRVPVGLLVLFAAVILLIGLLLTIHDMRAQARPFRAAGVLLCCAIFVTLAIAFLWTFDHSLAGGAYAFLAWRSFCVGVRLAVERADDASQLA